MLILDMIIHKHHWNMFFMHMGRENKKWVFSWPQNVFSQIIEKVE